MVLSVDSYREGPTSARGWQGSFLLYNSRNEPVDTAISFPIIGGGDQGQVTLTSPDGKASTHEIAGDQTLPVKLGARAWAMMGVAVVRSAL
jgi:hypothetical protein